MADSTTNIHPEFLEIVNQIRKNIGNKLLSTDELLFITADEIGHSYTMNEGKPAPEKDSHDS